MNKGYPALLSPIILIVTIFCCSTQLSATVFMVNSQQSFDNAHDAAVANDSIVWTSGTYTDIYMDITKDQLVITAEVFGGTIFTGASRVEIEGDQTTFSGFQYIGGDIGTNHVVNIRATDVQFTQVNIRDYTCYKYLRIREESRFVEVSYCNFENRINLDDQNILSVLVDEDGPGYHKIRYCSFKNFPGEGNDMGIEPIRVGVSTQADFISRTLVEYCYFTACDGDGEIISSKATQNVYRYNTFENNPKAELVLRHGSEGIIYGNFFLNGKGGIRVREGQEHYIYNNYFYDLEDRAIFLQNDPSDPLDNINIAFNTVINSGEVRLGGNGANPPTNVSFANNIFTDPKDDLFDDPTGTETWLRDFAFGSLGFVNTDTGIDDRDPELEINSEGFYGLSANSLAIDGEISGYALLPQFPGMDPIDTDISFDIMGQPRSPAGDKDIGCSEYPHIVLISPIATEENTGPSYNTSSTTSVSNPNLVVDDFIQVIPNPVGAKLNLLITSSDLIDCSIDLLSHKGQVIDSLEKLSSFSGETSIQKNISHLPAGIYFIRARGYAPSGRLKQIQSLKFIKVE